MIVGTIFKKELKLFVKRKGNFFWLIGMPIIFIVIMSLVFGNENTKVTVPVIDQDKSSFSQSFIKQLDSIPVIEVKQDQVSTKSDQINQLRKGNISALVVIPKGFAKQFSNGQQAKIQLYRDGSTNQVASSVEVVLNNISNQYREHKIQMFLQKTGQSKSEITTILQAPIGVQTVNESSTHVNAVTQVVPGYMIMFAFFIIMSMVTRFAQERDSGMVSRVRSSSLPSWKYLIGMWLPNVVMVLIQCTILLAFGNYVYGLELGNVAVIVGIVFSLSICCTGIGLAISLLVESDNAGKAITQLLTLGGAMLGGLWFPYDLLPAFVQAIGRFTPQYWAQHGMQEVMAHGANFVDIWPTFIVLIAIGIVGLFVALIRYPAFLRRAVN
jgi:ABC-2 type transport system permease protein